jgi:hypothetical protein
MSQSRPDQPLPDDAAFRYPMADTLDIGGFSMSSFGPDTVLTLHENTSFQPLGDGEGGVLLDTQSGQLFTCNDTTAAFLSAVDGTRNFAGILGELARQLADEGLIVRVDP